MKRRNYKDGKQYGNWTEWYENGQKIVEANYKENLWEDGKTTWWYENGQIESEKNYKDSAVAHGTWNLLVS